MSSEQLAAERKRLQSALAFWQKMYGQLDVDAGRLNKLACVLPLVSCAVALLAKSWLLFAGAMLLVASIWGMGRYMIAVRRVEYRYHLQSVTQQLDEAAAQIDESR